MVEKNYNLIYSFAEFFGVDANEYWEPLSIGLIKAVHDYERKNSNYKLSSFIYIQMKTEVLNFKKMQNSGSRIPADKKIYYQSDYDASYENLLIDNYNIEKDITGKLFIQHIFSLLSPLECFVAKKMYEGYSLSEIHKQSPQFTYRAINKAHKHIQRVFLHNYSQAERVNI